MKKIFFILSVLFIFSLNTSYWSYEEVSCDVDSIFSENSCSSCFDWGVKSEWDNLGLLTNMWVNSSNSLMYMLKWENQLDSSVEMIPLNGSAWSYEPTKDDFWEYSENFEKLTQNEGFYTLEPWNSVDWIQSKLGYSIRLNESLEAWENIGLLKYMLNVHMDEDWIPAESTVSQRECILFKSSGESNAEPVTQKEVSKNLPQTWPQEVLLLFLALMLSGLLFFVSKKKS